ncbi:HalOD1 output domain-containing protein [Halobellus sp. Atlit-38R]|uniref:HalOD1 output domain-containing protein n=1 Tax=Halobellus sp. Atlit-38R TaxID=2282131 RepID=UPI0011C399C0|nr:HalOD1 output domain-containing protein [Halobellus sp. Atlit-38R]
MTTQGTICVFFPITNRKRRKGKKSQTHFSFTEQAYQFALPSISHMSVGGLGDSEVEYVYDRRKVVPSLALVEAIAEAEDVQATQLSEKLGAPIGTYVNLDAIDNLVTEEDEVGVVLRIDEYRIHIDADTVTVEPRNFER